MLSSDDLQAIIVSLQLAAVTSIILLCLGVPLAWWLAKSRSLGKTLIEALVALPMVLPPTVLGFYLLVALAPDAPLGQLTQALFGSSVAFTFTGLVIGSVLYSMPFAIQPLQNSFEQLDKNILDAAATLGASPIDRFFSIILPASRNGVIRAAVMSFAHTVGEFGVILMIGGNIPGITRVASIALYDQVESMAYDEAHRLAAVLLLFSLITLIWVSWLRKKP